MSPPARVLGSGGGSCLSPTPSAVLHVQAAGGTDAVEEDVLPGRWGPHPWLALGSEDPRPPQQHHLPGSSHSEQDPKVGVTAQPGPGVGSRA